jgi:DNA repair protein RadD
MQFDGLLSRADIGVLQDLIGSQSLRLMGLLNVKSTSPTFLRELLLQSYGAVGLLLDKNSRGLLFDLLRPEEVEQLRLILGLEPSASPYEAIKAVSFSRGSTKETKLFDFFELTAPSSAEEEEDKTILGTIPKYPLFPHQRVAARKIRTALFSTPYRVLLHMPTGSGKTRTAMNIVADMLRAKEPRLIVWVVYSEELCSQACDEFVKAWTLIGDRKVRVYKLWGKRDFDPKDLTDGLVVAGLPKLEAKAKRSIEFIVELGKRCSAVIVDEAHQSVAPTYKTIIDSLISHHPEAALLGLTATPGRTWNNITADEELANFFFRRKVSLEVPGYPNPVDYLVAEGYLAKAEFSPLFYEDGTTFTPADLTRIQESLDLPQDVLERLSENETRNIAIIVRIENLLKKHKRVIVFASSVKHAHLLASVLFSQGHKAFAVTAKTPSSERSRIIEDFKSQDSIPRVITNYGVLTTGFDAPQTSAALIARPTRSLVLYSQMVGRAIRGTKAGGNATAEIVTVVEQGLPGFGNVADAFNNWEDIWL